MSGVTSHPSTIPATDLWPESSCHIAHLVLHFTSRVKTDQGTRRTCSAARWKNDLTASRQHAGCSCNNTAVQGDRAAFMATRLPAGAWHLADGLCHCCCSVRAPATATCTVHSYCRWPWRAGRRGCSLLMPLEAQPAAAQTPAQQARPLRPAQKQRLQQRSQRPAPAAAAAAAVQSQLSQLKVAPIQIPGAQGHGWTPAERRCCRS